MNVGGGYLNSDLSDIAFLWMKAKAASTGLAFDEAYVAEKTSPDPLGELRDSRSLIYRLWRTQDRPIGEGIPDKKRVYRGAGEPESASNEDVHPAVIERYAVIGLIDPGIS